MHYRKLGSLDIEISALGFGSMRLPVLNKDGELVGILSAQDLLGALEEFLTP